MGGKSEGRKAQIETRERNSRRDFARLRCACEVARHVTATAKDAKTEQGPGGEKDSLVPPHHEAAGVLWQSGKRALSFLGGARGRRATAAAGISIHAA